jgi:hypothetical protein
MPEIRSGGVRRCPCRHAHVFDLIGLAWDRFHWKQLEKRFYPRGPKGDRERERQEIEGLVPKNKVCGIHRQQEDSRSSRAETISRSMFAGCTPRHASMSADALLFSSAGGRAFSTQTIPAGSENGNFYTMIRRVGRVGEAGVFRRASGFGAVFSGTRWSSFVLEYHALLKTVGNVSPRRGGEFRKPCCRLPRPSSQGIESLP